MRYPLLALLVPLLGGTACSRDICDEAADLAIAEGWTRYRAGDLDAAQRMFGRARRRCQSNADAHVGLGYTALREQKPNRARRFFDAALARNSASIDALVGIGLVAWRQQDAAASLSAFLAVRELEPENATAAEYLERLRPAIAQEPVRPPLVLADSTAYPARAVTDFLEVRTANGWEPFYIKGINLGAALPGKHPSEFPDSTTYTAWLSDMVAMGANVVRVYTIHPPWFYQALLEHNRAHPASPLWLIHGVWAELPPKNNYEDKAWETDFFNEMRDVVDVLHGRADLSFRPGHAWGHYTANVSRWALAYIIGREWEPFSVQAFNERHRKKSEWSGRYVQLRNGTPMDAWLAKACDEIIGYEMTAYRAQRPVAYTNWPTLDPLHHPSETTVDEELAIRDALGETVEIRPREYDNDAVGLDAALLRATDQFPAGVFASYHAYPYYPDFVARDSAYERARSSEGPSTYFGYLSALKRHHGSQPVVISEYGVPASLGLAHMEPQGWHHGGLDEEAMGAVNARLTREIGMAGGALFAWIDEWFKKNWLVIDFEIPLERNRLWLNRLDPEQHYGVVAMDPGQILPGTTLGDRLHAWKSIAALYKNADGIGVKAAADEAYLWLLLAPGSRNVEEVLVGFDVIEPTAGDFRWPHRVGERLPVGIEFVLRIDDHEARLLADGPSNPVQIKSVRTGLPDAGVTVMPVHEAEPPGLFYGRVEQRFALHYRTRANDDGRYDSLLVIPNRPRFAPNRQEFAALGYDRGVLPHGPAPDGMWERDANTGGIEVRIPWMLLNFTDPSERRVLQDGAEARRLGEPFGTKVVESIGIVVATRDTAGTWRQWPAPADSVARFTWPTWHVPTWRARRRPTYHHMRATFETLAPAALMESHP